MLDTQYSKYNFDQNDAIINLFRLTFTKSEGAAEGEVIGHLVKEILSPSNYRDLQSFVAITNDQIVGCVIFSKIQFQNEDISSFILSPMAVHPDYQSQGIGQKLIAFGHNYLNQLAIDILLTYGDIRFYGKLGYAAISESIIEAPQKLSYPQGWLAQSLVGNDLSVSLGKIKCIDALNKEVYW